MNPIETKLSMRTSPTCIQAAHLQQTCSTLYGKATVQPVTVGFAPNTFCTLGETDDKYERGVSSFLSGQLNMEILLEPRQTNKPLTTETTLCHAYK